MTITQGSTYLTKSRFGAIPAGTVVMAMRPDFGALWQFRARSIDPKVDGLLGLYIAEVLSEVEPLVVESETRYCAQCGKGITKSPGLFKTPVDRTYCHDRCYQKAKYHAKG